MARADCEFFHDGTAVAAIWDYIAMWFAVF